MTCYYFHFSDGKRIFRDAAGVDLPDLGEARQEAIRCAQVLMAPQPDDVQALDWTAWKVIIATEGSSILEVPFAGLDRL